MFRKISISILIITLFYSCNHDCEVDKVFQKRYFKNIEVIEIPYLGSSEPVNVIKFREAMYFLMAITEIEPTGFDIEYGVYYTYEDFRNDKRKWENWYKNHKCEITNSLADSLLKNYMVNKQGRR